MPSFRAVFSSPPDSVADEEYHNWYDGHLDEILAYDGFLRARRYAVRALWGTGAPANYRFVSSYLIDGDPEATNTVVREAVAAGTIVHPDWFPLIRSSWAFYGLGPDELTDLPDAMVIVLATPPGSLDATEYADWYAATVEPVLAVRGPAVLYRVAPSTINEDAPSTATMASVIATGGDDIDTVDRPPFDGLVAVRAEALGPAKSR